MANNVTKVTEQGWAGERNMASRHSIPQMICVGKKKNRKAGERQRIGWTK